MGGILAAVDPASTQPDLSAPEFDPLRRLRAMFIDFDSFFASCEQQRDPALRGKPVGVIPVKTDGTCCIAASYEAKKFGVKTGTPVPEARRLCPGIRFVHAEHRVYIDFQQRALEAIDRCAPVWGVHSIDELSIRLCPATREQPAAEALVAEIKRTLAERIGPFVRCSAGIAPNRFLAKVGSGLDKPNGLCVLDHTTIPRLLFHRDVELLGGIGNAMGRRLRARGIVTIRDLYAAGRTELHRVWQSIDSELWWRQLRGGSDWYDRPTRRGHISHGHVMAPELRTPAGARALGVRLLTKACVRLRDEGYHATRLHVRVRFEGGWTWAHDEVFEPTRDSLVLLRVLARGWSPPTNPTPKQVVVVLGGLTPSAGVEDSLFAPARQSDVLSATLDRITRRYGYDAVYPASMHDAKRAAPRRIAFGNVPDLAIPDVEI